MKKERILILDDEPVVRALVQEVVTKAGHEAAAFADALSAAKAMTEKDYSVAICDVKMPGKNGIWFLKEIRKTSPDTQAIMVTASDALEDVLHP